MGAVTFAIEAKSVEWTNDVIFVDVAGAQRRTEVGTAVRMGLDSAVITAPEDETSAETFEPEWLAFDFATLEQRVPMIFRDAHEHNILRAHVQAC
jgi:hypothetical protein